MTKMMAGSRLFGDERYLLRKWREDLLCRHFNCSRVFSRLLITAGTSWFLGNYRFLGRILQEPWLLLPSNLQERLQEKHTGVRAVPVLHVGFCRNFLVPGEFVWFWATGRNGVPAGNNNLESTTTIPLRRHVMIEGLHQYQMKDCTINNRITSLVMICIQLQHSFIQKQKQ